jgi:hypothetical protein
MSSDAEFAVHGPGAPSCGRFGAGHDPHWIQVLRVAPRNRAFTLHGVRLLDGHTVELDVDVPDDGAVRSGDTATGSVGEDGATVRVGDDGATVRARLVRRNHAAGLILSAWDRHLEGRLIPGAQLLQIGPTTGADCFSIAGEGFTACRDRVGHLPVA